MHNPMSDLSFPNIRLLRQECLDRLYAAPLEPVSDREWDGIQKLMIDYIKETAVSSGKTERADWYTDPCLATIGQDLRESDPPLPKWVAATNWLSYDGIVKYHPILVVRVINAMLECRLDRL